MKDITGLSAAEIRIFKTDVIPFRPLITASNLKALTTPFHFKETELGEDQNEGIITAVKMKTGEFRHDEKIYPIDNLIIERRRLSFLIQAESEIAEIFYEKVGKMLQEIDSTKNFKEDSYVLKTMTTSCVVTLDIDYKNIFSKKMNSFVTQKASKVCSEALENKAAVEILPLSVMFSVNYDIRNKKVFDSDVSIQTKKLVIEPRVGTRMEDKRFFTSSPTDSHTHLKLITEFENIFK